VASSGVDARSGADAAKVLRVPRTHPLAWQLALVDSEFDQILAFRARHEAERAAARARRRRGGGFLRRGDGRQARGNRRGGGGERADGDSDDDAADGKAANDGEVAAIELAEDESCPICLDDMKPAAAEGGEAGGAGAASFSPLTHCRVKCGNWVHIKCMLEYAEHQVGGGNAVTCLLCRQVGRSAARFIPSAKRP